MLTAPAAAGAGAVTVANDATYNTTNFPASGQLRPQRFRPDTGRPPRNHGVYRCPGAAAGTFVNVTSKSPNPSYNAVNPPPPTSMRSTRRTFTSGSTGRRWWRRQKSPGSTTRPGRARTSCSASAIGMPISTPPTPPPAVVRGRPRQALFRFYNRPEDGLAKDDLPPPSTTPSRRTMRPDRLLQLTMPAAGRPYAIEEMIGQSFADLRALRTRIVAGDLTVEDSTTATTSDGGST